MFFRGTTEHDEFKPQTYHREGGLLVMDARPPETRNVAHVPKCRVSAAREAVRHARPAASLSCRLEFWPESTSSRQRAVTSSRPQSSGKKTR